MGVLVDAKPQAIAWYARYGFTEIPTLVGGSNSRPRPTALFLPLRSVQAAQAASGGERAHP